VAKSLKKAVKDTVILKDALDANSGPRLESIIKFWKDAEAKSVVFQLFYLAIL